MPSLVAADESITRREVDITDSESHEVTTINRDFVALSVGDYFPANAVSYYIHGDPGLDDASFAVCMSHPFGAELMPTEPGPAPKPFEAVPLKYGELPPKHTLKYLSLIHISEPTR